MTYEQAFAVAIGAGIAVVAGIAYTTAGPRVAAGIAAGLVATALVIVGARVASRRELAERLTTELRGT